MSILLFFENAVAAWMEPTVECNSRTEAIKREFFTGAVLLKGKLRGGNAPS